MHKIHLILYLLFSISTVLAQEDCDVAMKEFESDNFKEAIPLFDECITSISDSNRVLLYRLYQLRAYMHEGHEDKYAEEITFFYNLPNEHFNVKLKALIYKAKRDIMFDFDKGQDLMIQLDSLSAIHGDHEDRLITTTMLAQTYQMTSNNKLSYKYHKKALKLANVSNKEDYLALLNGISLASTRLGKDSTNFYLEKGLEFISQYYNTELNKGDSTRIASFYNTTGQYYNNTGQLTDAIDYFIKSINLTPDGYYYSLTKLSVLYSLIQLFINIKDFERADAYIAEAIPIVSKIKNQVTKGKHLSSLSKLMYETGNTAYADFLASVAVKNLSGSRYKKDISRALLVNAKYALQNNEVEKARDILDQLEDFKSVIEDIQHQAQYLLLSAEILVKERKFIGALNHANQLLDYASENSLNEYTIKAYRVLSDANFQIGKTDRAYEYQSQFHRLKDSTYFSEQNRYIAELNTKYKKAEQDLEIGNLTGLNNSQNNLIEKKNLQLQLGILAIVGFGVLSFFIFTLYRNKIANAKKLQQQNDIIQKALSDKELLLKEIHHRVKNNLQMVSSLLRLQSRYIKDHSALSAIKEGQNRVNSMTLIHQSLYVEDNLTSIRIEEYFHKLIAVLYDSYQVTENEIDLQIDVENLLVDIDIIIPIGLITNELISNAIKYAFHKTDKALISITFKKVSDSYQLTVHDNGLGFDKSIIHDNIQSFGYQMILSFVDRFDGHLDIDSSENAGTKVKICIPIIEPAG